MSSKSEMGRGKMPAKKKPSGLKSMNTSTGRMRATQGAKKVLSKKKAQAKVAARKLTGSTGRKASSGKVQRGGTPKRPSKVQSFMKRLRKGPSKK